MSWVPSPTTNPFFYELQLENEPVHLIGPALGQLREYGIDEFRALVNEGAWVFAGVDADLQSCLLVPPIRVVISYWVFASEFSGFVIDTIGL